MIFSAGKTNSRVWSWAFYDFANTIYSAVVVTVYLPLYLNSLSGRNTPLGLAATLSMILSGFLVPPLGTLTDRTGKTKLYLFLSTALCVLATASLSFISTTLGLLTAFITANILYHSSLVFYNSLLPVTAPPESQGFVSGLGTALGYLGVLFALPIAHFVDLHWGRQWVFLLAGILFFLFALPLFAWVPERAASSSTRISLKETVQTLAKNHPMLYFLLGNFFLLDVLNALILWLSVFLSKTFHLPQAKLIETILALNFSAFIFGIIAGKMTDRLGYKTVLISAGGALAVLLTAAASSHSFFWVRIFILLFGGYAAAGIWTAGRKGVVELSPPGRVGEFFGLYGFTSKVSAIGSTLLSLFADIFDFRIAVASQLVSVALGLFFLSRIQRNKTQ